MRFSLKISTSTLNGVKYYQRRSKSSLEDYIGLGVICIMM